MNKLLTDLEFDHDKYGLPSWSQDVLEAFRGCNRAGREARNMLGNAYCTGLIHDVAVIEVQKKLFSFVQEYMGEMPDFVFLERPDYRRIEVGVKTGTFSSKSQHSVCIRAGGDYWTYYVPRMDCVYRGANIGAEYTPGETNFLGFEVIHSQDCSQWPGFIAFDDTGINEGHRRRLDADDLAKVIEAISQHLVNPVSQEVFSNLVIDFDRIWENEGKETENTMKLYGQKIRNCIFGLVSAIKAGGIELPGCVIWRIGEDDATCVLTEERRVVEAPVVTSEWLFFWQSRKIDLAKGFDVDDERIIRLCEGLARELIELLPNRLSRALLEYLGNWQSRTY
ncbi:MAG: hypothetical protein A3E37_03355 [Candidatus Andersenbacteria bacterium RIFCSPHIGHO2_12_FULL_46_9]|nr:MAG: hypothetical protein UW94_C0008G0061 [Parcubacteria group bacterium GW2011_GWA2_45_14]OGY35660.1 MAG: hypothetical protein A3B76_05445 [Candidatus Andersenbacteria bacterium RIFCSPHIGHO2_02_FULL_46_16]OGY36862.1 MAG: hypothetical protein A3I08_03275 [Candidatus Andersenbacteria bacterium RIFCSPLOWO2_02_FULL_46_11]OGY37820.1 MAG: hypothetical protein A3E37_03355 [Candidatus Andersenbacteria bacterium RIFCSPHIGHO2_12_FULL_46_9]OGY41662.1 MAG: hypothetical protein A3G57_02180 [Candidatus A